MYYYVIRLICTFDNVSIHRKVLSIGEGGGQGSEYWERGGGSRGGGQIFRWL